MLRMAQFLDCNFDSDEDFEETSRQGREELFFFKSDSGDIITAPLDVRDEKWATNNCPYTWDSQGTYEWRLSTLSPTFSFGRKRWSKRAVGHVEHINCLSQVLTLSFPLFSPSHPSLRIRSTQGTGDQARITLTLQRSPCTPGGKWLPCRIRTVM